MANFIARALIFISWKGIQMFKLTHLFLILSEISSYIILKIWNKQESSFFLIYYIIVIFCTLVKYCYAIGRWHPGLIQPSIRE